MVLRWLQWQGSSRWRTLVDACAVSGWWAVGLQAAGKNHTTNTSQRTIRLPGCSRLQAWPAAHVTVALPSRPLPQARTFILSVPTRSTVVKPGLRKRLVMSLTWGRGQGEAGEAARVVERVSPWGVFRCKGASTAQLECCHSICCL